MKTISLKTLLFNLIILLAITIVILLTCIQFSHIYADGQIKRYYYILQNTSMILDSQPLKGNIQLNASYYVEATGNPDVIINDISYKIVIYNGITGRVQSNALSKKTIDNIQTPFFISNSKLTAQSQDEILMFDNIVDNKSTTTKLANNTKLDFIAYSESGEYILARLSDNTIGFVKKNFCTPTIIYSPHPNPINPDTEINNPSLTPDNPTQETKTPNKATITRIVLIITLCVVVVIVIFLLFKPSGNKHKPSAKESDFYDY